MKTALVSLGLCTLYATLRYNVFKAPTETDASELKTIRHSDGTGLDAMAWVWLLQGFWRRTRKFFPERRLRKPASTPSLLSDAVNHRL